MTPTQFALISPTAIVRPNHPGVLIIPPGTTQHMTTTLREQHKEDIHLFKEVKGVEKALIQNIVKTVRPEYLNALRNRNTTSITGTVYNIIDHISMTYGRVTAQMFDAMEEEVRKMTYNPTRPIDNIFTAIDDLIDLHPETMCYTSLLDLEQKWTIHRGNQSMEPSITSPAKLDRF